MSNVYYDPEALGLEIVSELDDPDASYSFDKFVIWRRRKDGVLFYKDDSGCSCPSPFEGIDSTQELSELKNMKAFENDLRAWGSKYFDSQILQAVIDKVQVTKLYRCVL